ncbi:MAG: hypothetical protein DMF68_17365 [Acidobacteria bacterium]|nr:MAG: hypothetical protein DMF68_17365 [Acidobacteriota bacterium]
MDRQAIITDLQDTTPEAERVLIELTRQTPMWKRAEQLSNLIFTGRVLILADLRRRYPNADADELHKRMAARLLPREDVIRMFGWDPEKEGY